MKALLFVVAAWPALAQVELAITFGVLQNAVAAQVFTEDGRRYVKGNKDKRCSYAFLENPRVSEWDGRLLVRAKFSGRSSFNVLGQCVGIGDSFDVLIRMTPYADKTTIRLRDVDVASDGKRGVYARAVCKALAATLPRVLVYDLAPDFKRTLEAEQVGVPYRKQVEELTVQSLHVSKEALVLQLALRLTLR